MQQFCLDLPPNITLFRVIETDSRFVRLAWAHQYLFKSAYKFHYELDWWSQGLLQQKVFN